jgi:hypothetical protein
MISTPPVLLGEIGTSITWILFGFNGVFRREHPDIKMVVKIHSICFFMEISLGLFFFMGVWGYVGTAKARG